MEKLFSAYRAWPKWFGSLHKSWEMDMLRTFFFFAPINFFRTFLCKEIFGTKFWTFLIQSREKQITYLLCLVIVINLWPYSKTLFGYKFYYGCTKFSPAWRARWSHPKIGPNLQRVVGRSLFPLAKELGCRGPIWYRTSVLVTRIGSTRT